MMSKPKAQACPHCKAVTLVKTLKEKVDTSEQTVRIWECSSCGYTEGRPVKG